MAVYAMVHIDVNDADEYAKYAEIAGPAVAKFGGTFLARGGECVQMEGKGRARNVIIRFGDMETAKKFYHSEEYQKLCLTVFPQPIVNILSSKVYRWRLMLLRAST